MLRISCLIPVLLLGSLACGGGGSAGGVMNGDTNLRASFSAAQPAPMPNSVHLAGGAVTGRRVTVLVQITDVADIYEASFDLEFDSSAIDFVGYQSGDALELGGQPLYEASEQNTGLVTVSVTLLGNVPGVDIAGTRDLIGLTFEIRQVGQFPLRFLSQRLRDPQAVNLSVSNWFEGTLVGN